MAREKKDAKNFTGKIDRKVFERLEEYCRLSGLNKTVVVERALNKYFNDNLEKMRKFSEELQDSGAPS